MHVLRLVLLGIAIGVAIILGVRFAGNPFVTQVARRETPAPASIVVNLSPEVARETVERQIGSARDFAPFFKTMRENFPAEYERALTAFSERAQSAPPQSPDEYLAEMLRGLRRTHGVLAAKASVSALERVFELQGKIVGALAEANPQLCADFLYGNAPAGFFRFSATHRSLVAAMADAGLEAIIDGRSLNIERNAPADEDFTVLEAELEKKGLGKPEIEALLDGKTPEPPLSDTAMCRAGVVYFDTLRSLPADARLKIYALAIRLLARS